MSLDTCVEYLATDEVLEVTPSKKRMAKNPDLQVKRKGKKYIIFVNIREKT
jgi:predicted membrane GTPase involved in stress response